MLKSFDQSDLVRFATVAFKLASKRGQLTLLEKGLRLKGYYALCGNLLYNFEKENDSSSAIALHFLESSTVKISNFQKDLSSDTVEHILTITLLGGKTIMLTSPDVRELQSWLDAIESAKFVYMSRRLEDNEASSIQLNHRVEQQDIALQSLEMLLQESKTSYADLLKANGELKAQLAQANAHINDLKYQLKEKETDRLLLLKSRGIIPKVLPLWAMEETPREG